jgi:hypothetical protein
MVRYYIIEAMDWTTDLWFICLFYVEFLYLGLYGVHDSVQILLSNTIPTP